MLISRLEHNSQTYNVHFNQESQRVNLKKDSEKIFTLEKANNDIEQKEYKKRIQKNKEKRKSS